MSDEHTNPKSEVITRMMATIDQKIDEAVTPLLARIEALERQRESSRLSDDRILRSFSLLVSLQEVALRAPMKWDMIERYNDLVDTVAAESGLDLSEFKSPVPVASWATFHFHIGGLLGYLSALMPEEAVRRAGFETERPE